MEPRISIITLGVTDLPRSAEFYRDGLGLPLFDENTESIAFFQNRGAWLALYPRESLAADVGIAAEGSGFSGVTVAHNVRTRGERGGRWTALAGRGRCGRRYPREAGPGHILGRLLRLLRRPGRLPMGSRLEPPLLDRVTGL